MNIGEYYKFPEGFMPKLRYVPNFYELNSNLSLPADMKYGFENWGGWILPELDFSNVTTMKSMCYNSSIRKVDARNWDLSNVTDLSSLFGYCSSLIEVDFTGVNLSKVTTMDDMLNSCSKLEKVSSIDCSGIKTKNTYPLDYYSTYNNLTYLGGFLGMKMSWDDTYGLAKCPNLTYESCINILNGLYDFVGNNEEVGTNQGVLKVHSNFLTLVGDEISIGTNKGWTITA